MTFGVTTAGFVAKRADDIKTEIEAALRATLGPGINLAATSTLGQIVGIIVEREAAIWEMADDVYNSAYPDTADGVPLDNAVALSGITRREATKSTVTATLTGTPATVVPQGSVASVTGQPESRFVLDEDATIGGGGTVSATFTAEDAGAVQAPAATLIVIETPVSGWASLTNALDAEVGNEIESDAELKLRRVESTQKAGTGTVDAIRADLLQLSGVEACVVFENETMATVSGRPPKSFEAIVLGGDDEEIAQTIWEDKPAGIEAFGSTTVEVLDSQGFAHDVSFSRPTEVDIYVELTLTVDSDYPVTGDDLVKAAIVAYGDGLGIGDDVIVYPHLMASIADIPGITDVVLTVGTAASPTLDDNIAIGVTERAAFDTSRVVVVS